MNTKKNPDELLTAFSKTPFMRYIVFALIIHTLLILFTSIGFLIQKATGKDGVKPQATEATATPTPAPAITPPTPTPSPIVTPTPTQNNNPRNDAPVIKRIDELPKQTEIPKTPDDIGISLEETSPGS